jgi:hypothetical protein
MLLTTYNTSLAILLNFDWLIYGVSVNEAQVGGSLKIRSI